MNTLSRTLALIALFFCCWQTAANAQVCKARVVLTNKQVLRGYLAEPWNGGNLLLRLTPHTTLEVDSADLLRVKQMRLKGSKAHQALRQKARETAYGQKLGFYHQIFTGASFGEEVLNPSLGSVNGYRFNSRYALGLGINYDRYANTAALPVYLQGRAYLKNGGVSLYSFAEGGYGAAWQNRDYSTNLSNIRTRGGLMGQLGLGYQVNFSNSALNFSLGYKLQKMNTHYEYFQHQFSNPGNWQEPTIVKYMDIEERRLIRRMVFTIGLSL